MARCAYECVSVFACVLACGRVFERLGEKSEWERRASACAPASSLRESRLEILRVMCVLVHAGVSLLIVS